MSRIFVLVEFFSFSSAHIISKGRAIFESRRRRKQAEKKTSEAKQSRKKQASNERCRRKKNCRYNIIVIQGRNSYPRASSQIVSKFSQVSHCVSECRGPIDLF